MRGRLLVMVPDVLGPRAVELGEPCVPLAGPTGTPMGVYMVPPIGAGVWVEFEQGDPTTRSGSAASGAAPPRSRRWRTLGPAGLARTSCSRRRRRTRSSISDLPGPTGGIMLKSATGATLIVNDTGIYIQNGKGASIVMTGPTVTINNGALTVV